MSFLSDGLASGASPEQQVLAFGAILLGAPLASALISALLFRKSRWGAPVLSLAAAATILWASLNLLFAWNGVNPMHASFELFRLGSLSMKIGFLFDKTAAPMLFVVSFVGFLIHVFSVGYMDDDKARGRFFAGLSVFMFSILGIVLSDNLLMTFVFWELVGFSSYMLIAHYYDKDFAAAASKKAFITNRVGDVFFLTGILWAGVRYGSYSFEGIGHVSMFGGATADTVIGLLLMCGFIGKSAQFPLQVWLTDAMAGPTPVSALIHAATMVAAGVYLMVKLAVCGVFTPEVYQVFLWSGAAMAALAAFCALGQTDIKKSLAYSTLSHLGFMGAAIGLGAPEIALLHMLTHAFFKATLFLCAGSVIHGCHHEQDMTRMGGLLKRMPITAVAFTVAGLSLCAFPWFAGWYSKDMILTRALVINNYGAFALLVFGAIGSTLYVGRMFRMVFLGEARSDDAAHAHESSVWMSVPLLILGAFSIFVTHGLSAEHGRLWSSNKMNGLLPTVATEYVTSGYHRVHHAAHEAHLVTPMLLLGIAILVLGLGAAIVFYKKDPDADALREKCPVAYSVLERRWTDNVYDWYVASVQQRVAGVIAFADKFLLEGVTVRGVFAGIPAVGGLLLRRYVFTGRIGDYAKLFVIGAAGYYLYALVS